MKNRLFKLISLSILLLPVLASCGGESFEKQLNDKLLKLDNVRNVCKLDNSNKDFLCQYEVIFNIPINWDAPNGETFQQKVVVDAKSFTLPTVVELQGYMMADKYLFEGYTRELPTLLNANFVAIEHRYFGESLPGDPDYDGVSYWDQLTVVNAAKDHEFIIKQLRKVFTGKWVATGNSKGGYITNVLASYFPDTCDVYVPYVAPLAKQFDNRPFEFLSKYVGNNLYGESRAEVVRNEILDFQLYCFDHKYELIDLLFSEAYCPKDALFRDAVTKENIFDINMLEFSYIFWQYLRLDISVIEDFLHLDDNIGKIVKAADIIKQNDTGVEQFRYNKPHYPYYMTALKEMGNLHYDFSFIKEQAEARRKSINISIDPEDEIDIYTKMIYSEDQLTYIDYDNSVYNHLVSWINDTNVKTKVVMINGLEDPWYYVSIPQPLNMGENIRIYNHPTANHRVQITDFDDQTKTEILNTISSWIK